MSGTIIGKELLKFNLINNTIYKMNTFELITSFIIMIAILALIGLYNNYIIQNNKDINNIPENIEYCSNVVFGGMKNDLDQDCTYLLK